MTNLDSILKSRNIIFFFFFLDKGLYSYSYVFSSSHVWMRVRVGPYRLIAEEWMLSISLSHYGARKDSGGFLGLQGDQTHQNYRKSTLQIHWVDFCCSSWSFNTLATWCEKPLEKTLILGKIEGKRSGQQRMRWLDTITNSTELNLSKLLEMVEDRRPWHTIDQEITRSWTWLNNWQQRISEEIMCIRTWWVQFPMCLRQPKKIEGRPFLDH